MGSFSIFFQFHGAHRLFDDYPARVKWRDELSSFQGVQSAETAAQFGGTKFPFAKEPADELLGVAHFLIGVAFPAARHQAGGRALIPKNTFEWPILAGLFFARVGSFSIFFQFSFSDF